jgi:hypothetical protein
VGLKQQVRYLEKQHLRPFLRRVRSWMTRRAGSGPDQHLARLEALEARVAELEQVIQEDLGLRLSEPPVQGPPPEAGR